MAQLIDATGFEYTPGKRPQRIISLVPSISETLFELGVEDEVVGITRFCVHPVYWRKFKETVGGTKKIKLDKIAELQPDMVFASINDNEKEEIEALRAMGITVYIFDVRNYDQALDMIRELGAITNTRVEARKMVEKIEFEFAKLDESVKDMKPLKTAYMIWKKPWMVAGGDTFVNDMLKRNNLENVFENFDERYPKLLKALELKRNLTQLVLLPSEPYPFGDDEVRELGPATRHALQVFVDGQIFSWPGARMAKAPAFMMAMNERMRRHDEEFNLGDQ